MTAVVGAMPLALSAIFVAGSVSSAAFADPEVSPAVGAVVTATDTTTDPTTTDPGTGTDPGTAAPGGTVPIPVAPGGPVVPDPPVVPVPAPVPAPVPSTPSTPTYVPPAVSGGGGGGVSTGTSGGGGARAADKQGSNAPDRSAPPTPAAVTAAAVASAAPASKVAPPPPPPTSLKAPDQAALVATPDAITPGADTTLAGSGCKPDMPVQILQNNQVLGTTTADDSGRFISTVTPTANGLPGRAQIEADCGTELTTSVDFVVSTASAPGVGVIAMLLLIATGAGALGFRPAWGWLRSLRPQP